MCNAPIIIIILGTRSVFHIMVWGLLNIFDVDLYMCVCLGLFYCTCIGLCMRCCFLWLVAFIRRGFCPAGWWTFCSRFASASRPLPLCVSPLPLLSLRLHPFPHLALWSHNLSLIPTHLPSYLFSLLNKRAMLYIYRHSYYILIHHQLSEEWQSIL